jgi:hypothetical protein
MFLLEFLFTNVPLKKPKPKRGLQRAGISTLDDFVGRKMQEMSSLPVKRTIK